MNDMSAFLAALAANYVPPQSEEARQQTKVIAVSMTGEKLVKVDRNRKAIDGSQAAPSPKGIDIPKYVPVHAEPLSAQDFLSAIRSAGKLSGEEKKKAERLALERFGGYHFGTGHGMQVDNATRTARSKVKGSGPEAVRVVGSVFVKGLPNGEKKNAHNLQARLNLALDTCNAIEKEIASGLANEYAPKLLKLERERASVIRAEIDAL